MQIDLTRLLIENYALSLFTIVAVGHILGRIRIRGYTPGPMPGVLLTALFLGHLGCRNNGLIQEFGFLLFMYCVAFQAGPRFFSMFAKDGKRYILIAGCVTLTGLTCVHLCESIFDFSFGHSAGLLAGALTSTPTLAAARDAINSSLSALPEGINQAQALKNVTVSYALTYIFGMLGIMLLVQLLPWLFSIELKAELARLNPELLKAETVSENFQLVSRVLEIRNPSIVGPTLKELRFRNKTECLIEQIRRRDQTLNPGPETKLELGDRLLVVGAPEALKKLADWSGEIIEDDSMGAVQLDSARIVVTKSTVIGKALSSTNIHSGGCFLNKVIRSHIELPVSADLVLEAGDILCVNGPKSRLKLLAAQFGFIEKEVYQTDMLTMALGIALGLFIGKFKFYLGSVEIGLGSAGGILLMGILIGFWRSRTPVFGAMPQAARYVFMELGMLIFMANVGLEAGQGIWQTLTQSGWMLIVSGLFVTTIPPLTAFAFGYFVLKLNAVLLLGSVAGAMTSTPSLNIANRFVGNDAPALGYAGCYAFANVFLTLAGSYVLRI